MKKFNIQLIFGVLIAFLALTIGIIGTNRYITSHKYEVVTDTTTESPEELNAVVEVITKGTYQKVESLKNENDRAYVVVADKNINNNDIEEVINIGKNLNIKMSFLENKTVNSNKEIQQVGDTVIPTGVDLNRALEEHQINALTLENLYSWNTRDKKSMVIFIDNVKELEKNKNEFNERINDLKAQGYTFRAFA